MIGWQIIGPIIALLISIGFTIWHTRKLRHEDKEELYRKSYLDAADKWADNVIDACNRLNSMVAGTEFGKVKQDIEKLFDEAIRLSLIKLAGDKLPNVISNACSVLSNLFTGKRYDLPKIKKLKEICVEVKDFVAEQRYEKIN